MRVADYQKLFNLDDDKLATLLKLTEELEIQEVEQLKTLRKLESDFVARLRYTKDLKFNVKRVIQRKMEMKNEQSKVG